MLKANKRTLIVTSIVTVLPTLAGVLLWSRLPDPMATHFGTSGQADGFSSRTIAVFGLPLLLLGIEWLMALVTSHDPRKQNISPKLITLVLWLVPVISVVTSAMMYAYNLGYATGGIFAAELLLGVIFIVTGNYLPKARQNYTIGIRLPWTLANEENWNRTHRLAGFLWVAGGIVSLAAALTGLVKAEWLIGVFAVMALVPCVYSFLLHVRRGL